MYLIGNNIFWSQIIIMNSFGYFYILQQYYIPNIRDYMTTAEDKYYQIIENLQPKFIKNLQSQQDYKKLFDEMGAILKKDFNLQITFDATIVKALKRKMQEEFKHYYYENNFLRTLEFIKKFAMILRKEVFIAKRHEQVILKRVHQFESDICLRYFSCVDYLRGATDKEAFRQDFMWKYVGIKDQEEMEDWEDYEFKKAYTQFWEKLFRHDPNPNIKLVTYIYSCFCKFQDPYTMLDQPIRQKINKIIGQNMGKTEIQVQLNKQLKLLAFQNFYQNSFQTKQRINKQFQLISNLLNRFSGTKKIQELKLQLRVAKFGSLVSGFGGTDSDLDITILTNTYVNENNFLAFLNQFLKVQLAEHDKKTGRTTKVNKIDASTPLVQVVINQKRRQGEFKIDILINNNLGVINSRFLSVYAQIPWVKQLGILFKLWAKKNQVITKELLSSYAIINMMIYFLIKKNYVNLIMDARRRNKQTQKFDLKRIKNGVVQQFQVYYEYKNNPDNVTSLKNVNLAEIMKQLFQFYSESGQHWKKNQGKNIISIDGNYGKLFQDQYVFTIQDPFDKPHNPGRAKIVHKDFFTNRFKQGFNGFSQLQKQSKRQSRESLLKNIFG